MKLNNYLILGAIFIITATLTGCGNNKEAETKKEQPAYPVKVEAVKRQTLYQTIELYGNVHGQRESNVYSKVPGKLLKKLAVEGQTVKEDDKIALVDRDEVAMKYAEAEVRSPIDGIVTKYFVSEGASVFPGQQPIAMVADISNVVLEVYANLEDVSSIKIGQRAICTTDSGIKKTYNGRVKEIDRAVDPMSRKSKVSIEINNRNAALQPGMFLKAQIIIKEKRNALSINQKAVIEKPDGNFAAVIEGDSAKIVPVEVGLKFNKVYEVTSGLKSGQKVIVEGNYGLTTGAKVKVVE